VTLLDTTGTTGTLKGQQIRQTPNIIDHIHIYQAVQKREKKTVGENNSSHEYIYKKAKEAKSSDATIFPQSLRVPERAPPPQWIWSLWYPLFSSFQAARLQHLVLLLPGGGGGILDNSFPEWHSEIFRRSGFSGAATLLRHLEHLLLSNERNPPPQWIFPLCYSLSSSSLAAAASWSSPTNS
jgi:hypothetical protein